MPGITMDESGRRNTFGPGVQSASQAQPATHRPNGDSFLNSHSTGQEKETNGVNCLKDALSALADDLPPEIAHISEGFYPFSTLVNRAVQQCWNDLTELLNNLGGDQLQQNNWNHAPEGKFPNDSKSVIKKQQALEFLQAKRADFIKLLVLSQWSRQSSEVSGLIDIHALLRTRYDAYNNALIYTGAMKRDLGRAQMGNPDLETALEAISTGKIASMTLPMVPTTTHLTPKEILKTLKNINKLIRLRLTLHENVPSFASYVIHDGRVTFTVPDEFEIDLSVALSSHLSQFYFVDIRFLFSPSSPIPKGRVRDGLDHRINASLMKHGIAGCFSMLHNLVLTQKVIVCFRQALELSRSHWRGHLRVDLLHRTLVIHYWANRSSPKSWLEIGIRKDLPLQPSPNEDNMSILHLRWMRNNKEVSTDDIPFDTRTICMESTLRAVISRHISFILEELYQSLNGKQLYRAGRLSLSLNTSETEPGDCYLDIQLTSTKRVRGAVEPMSGSFTIQSATHNIGRNEREIVGDKSLSGEIFDSVCRLRCIAAAEEVELHARTLGWKLVWPGSLDIENLRRSFPSEETPLIRLFQCEEWKNGWLTAFTASPEGDNWWIVQMQQEKPTVSIPGTVPQSRNVILQKSRVVTGWCQSSKTQLRYSTFASLAYALAGMVVIQSNATCLAECGFNQLQQSSGSSLGFNLRSRNTFVRSRHVKSGLPYISGRPKDKGEAIHETVRLSYRGIDSKTNRGIVIVSGFLKTNLVDNSFASRNINPSWAFQLGKRKFAMRLLSRVGEPVIARVLSRLQKLFNTIAALKYLQDKNFNPLSISSTRLTFTYPGSEDMKGCLTFHYPPEAAKDQVDLSTKPSEPASASVFFSFNRGSPHNRIRESLTSMFNRSSISLEFLLELLSVTLPLLRALDHICVDRNITRGNPYSVQVTSRNPKTYQIFYPSLHYRFHITLKQRKYHAFWLIRNITSPDVKAKEEEFEDTLRKKFFNVKGDGWRGIEGSALADLTKVENFIQLLDDVMKSRIETLSASKNSSDQSALKSPKREPGTNGIDKPLLPGTKANGIQKPQLTGSKGGDTQLQGTLDFENSGSNIITID